MRWRPTEMVFERIRRLVKHTFVEPDIDNRIKLNLKKDRKNLKADERRLAKSQCPERRVELLQLIESHKASIAWNENYLTERGLLKEGEK
jgi:hypothetical protein